MSSMLIYVTLHMLQSCHYTRHYTLYTDDHYLTVAAAAARAVITATPEGRGQLCWKINGSQSAGPVSPFLSSLKTPTPSPEAPPKQIF
ncbi:hypothetical protein J6590_047619 [Homalodisca vitripennis]|nr:hypothetical protein J6590_047619 [Homalodisca vitripennis]